MEHDLVGRRSFLRALYRRFRFPRLIVFRFRLGPGTFDLTAFRVISALLRCLASRPERRMPYAACNLSRCLSRRPLSIVYCSWYFFPLCVCGRYHGACTAGGRRPPPPPPHKKKERKKTDGTKKSVREARDSKQTMVGVPFASEAELISIRPPVC